MMRWFSIGFNFSSPHEETLTDVAAARSTTILILLMSID
jgi:hypothetical protein